MQFFRYSDVKEVGNSLVSDFPRISRWSTRFPPIFVFLARGTHLLRRICPDSSRRSSGRPCSSPRPCYGRVSAGQEKRGVSRGRIASVHWAHERRFPRRSTLRDLEAVRDGGTWSPIEDFHALGSRRTEIRGLSNVTAISELQSVPNGPEEPRR